MPDIITLTDPRSPVSEAYRSLRANLAFARPDEPLHTLLVTSPAPDADKAEVAKALPDGAVIYTHCGAGGRAARCGELLRKLGYDVKALKPGYKALIEAGFPNAEGK